MKLRVCIMLCCALRNLLYLCEVGIKTHNKANKMNIDKEKLESIEAKLYVVLD